MTDIWLPGLPPAYTDWSYCVGALELEGLAHDDAVILAAIGGPESSYDYRVINDTPATGDYSVGIWQVNYYGALYSGRAAEFGTPRQLIESGPIGQAKAAAAVFRQQWFFAWDTTYTSGDWRQYVGSGPIPHPKMPPGGPPGPIDLHIPGLAEVRSTAQVTARQLRALVGVYNTLARKGTPGWRPGRP